MTAAILINSVLRELRFIYFSRKSFNISLEGFKNRPGRIKKEIKCKVSFYFSSIGRIGFLPQKVSFAKIPHCFCLCGEFSPLQRGIIPTAMGKNTHCNGVRVRLHKQICLSVCTECWPREASMLVGRTYVFSRSLLLELHICI